MTDYGDEDRYYHQRDKRALWWVIVVGGVMLGFAVTLAVFLAIDTRPEQPARITPIPSAAMTVTETPATVTETPPVTLTETKTETSTATVVVTRTEPVTTTVTTTVTGLP